MFSKLINALSIYYLKSNDQYSYQEEQSSVCKLQIQNSKCFACTFVVFFKKKILALFGKIELLTAKRK